jgi:hypothetical protein
MRFEEMLLNVLLAIRRSNKKAGSFQYMVWCMIEGKKIKFLKKAISLLL